MGFCVTENVRNENRFTRQSRTHQSENRLIKVEPTAPTAGDSKVGFTYDHQGRRTTKTVSHFDGTVWSLPETTAFVYDGWNLIAEIPAAGQNTYYTWGPDLSGSMQGAGGIGGLLAVTTDSGTYLPAFDGNGNVCQYIDASDGSVAAEREYSPFGQTVALTGDKKDEFSFWFSTKYEDAETGLYYYGYRYYSPELGRWPSRDPIVERGGLNLYGFVCNAQIMTYDILGRDTGAGTPGAQASSSPAADDEAQVSTTFWMAKGAMNVWPYWDWHRWIHYGTQPFDPLSGGAAWGWSGGDQGSMGGPETDIYLEYDEDGNLVGGQVGTRTPSNVKPCVRKTSGCLRYGNKAKTECDDEALTDAGIWDCVKNTPAGADYNSWDWSWDLNYNCIDFVSDALKACCLECTGSWQDEPTVDEAE